MAGFWVTLAGTDDHFIFSLLFPHDDIEIAYLASVLLVKLGSNTRKRVVVTEEATFFCCENSSARK